MRSLDDAAGRNLPRRDLQRPRVHRHATAGTTPTASPRSSRSSTRTWSRFRNSRIRRTLRSKPGRRSSSRLSTAISARLVRHDRRTRRRMVRQRIADPPSDRRCTSSRFSIERRERRGALAATIDVGGTLLHVLAAHLGLRIPDVVFRCAGFSTTSTRFERVLHRAGGFQRLAAGPVGRPRARRAAGQPPRPASFPVYWPMVPLDRIWVHPLTALRRVFAHQTPAARLASDHLPVVAELEALRGVEPAAPDAETVLVTASS